VDAGVGYTMIDNESSERLQVTDIRCEYTSDRIILEDSSFIPTPNHDKPRMGSALHKERITSAYLSAMKRWKGFTAKAGLRYEHARYDRENRRSTIFIEYYPMVEVYLFAGPYKKDYGFHQSTDRLLPSASLRYQTTLGHQWEIQWGMSILRPNFYDLNPSRTFTSPMDCSSGSPFLMPSYTSNIELGYHHRKGLSVVAYFHHGSDQVEWNSVLLFSGHGNHTRTVSPENCFSSDRTGISLSYQVRPVSQLKVLAESDVIYYNAWLPSDDSRPDIYGWGGRFRLSADLFLNRQRTLMFSAHYNQWIKQYVGLRRYDSYSRFYFALRYSMLSDRLKLSLVADDPFRQHVTDAESYYERRTECDHVNHHSHSIGLTVSYSFGGKAIRRAYRDMKNAETKRAEKRWDVNNR
jgi:outer membrane receptor protein involved in Fe transport